MFRKLSLISDITISKTVHLITFQRLSIVDYWCQMNHKQGNVIHKYEALWVMVIQACFNKESTFSLYLDYT